MSFTGDVLKMAISEEMLGRGECPKKTDRGRWHGATLHGFKNHIFLSKLNTPGTITTSMRLSCGMMLSGKSSPPVRLRVAHVAVCPSGKYFFQAKFLFLQAVKTLQSSASTHQSPAQEFWFGLNHGKFRDVLKLLKRHIFPQHKTRLPIKSVSSITSRKPRGSPFNFERQYCPYSCFFSRVESFFYGVQS